MKRIASIAAASALALTLHIGALHAQQSFTEGHLEAARGVIVGSGMVRTFDVVIPEVQQAMRRQLVTQPAIAREVDEVFEQLEPEMELQRRAMVNRAARIMAERLTEEELSEIAAFFASDAGRRYVETQPVVLEDIILAVDMWGQELSEYIQIRVRAEMQQRGHDMR
jgi:uncharacterized protein